MRGEHGSLDLFPQVELFEFKGEDLTEEEDGGIIRRIRTRGEGYAKPNDGAIVEGETAQSGIPTRVMLCRVWVTLGGSIPFSDPAFLSVK